MSLRLVFPSHGVDKITSGCELLCQSQLQDAVKKGSTRSRIVAGHHIFPRTPHLLKPWASPQAHHSLGGSRIPERFDRKTPGLYSNESAS